MKTSKKCISKIKKREFYKNERTGKRKEE